MIDCQCYTMRINIGEIVVTMYVSLDGDIDREGQNCVPSSPATAFGLESYLRYSNTVSQTIGVNLNVIFRHRLSKCYIAIIDSYLDWSGVTKEIQFRFEGPIQSYYILFYASSNLYEYL